MFAGPLFRCLSMAPLCFGLWIVLISIHEAFERCLSVIFVYPTHCFSHLSHPFVVSFLKKNLHVCSFLLRDTLQWWDSWDSVQTETSVQFWRRRRHLLLFVKTVQTFQKETLCYCVCETSGYCTYVCVCVDCREMHVNMFTKWSLPLWQHHRKSKPGQRELNGARQKEERWGGWACLTWLWPSPRPSGPFHNSLLLFSAVRSQREQQKMGKIYRRSSQEIHTCFVC